MNGKVLTPKQEAFVEQFLIDLNATQAAIRAGYSAKTANRIGSENLSKPVIAQAIQKAMDARSKRTEIEADAVLQELACIGFSNMGDYASWGPDGVLLKQSAEISPDAMAAVAVVTHQETSTGKTIRFKLHDKLSALEKLGKHLRLFTDVLQLSPQEELQNLSDEELEARAQRLFPEAFAAFNRTRQ